MISLILPKLMRLFTLLGIDYVEGLSDPVGHREIHGHTNSGNTPPTLLGDVSTVYRHWVSKTV
jgi:hypothetical protein